MKDIIKQLTVVLDSRQKWECLLIFISSFMGSMIELLGISAILPFIQLLLIPDEVLNHPLGRYINSVFKCSNSNQIIVFGGVIIMGVYLAKNIYLLEQTRYQIKKINNIRWSLSSKVINSYLRRDYLFYTQTNSSVLLRGTDLDISATTDVIANLFRVMSELITVLAIIVYLLCTNFLMSLMIALVISLCLLWFVLRYRKRIREAGRKYNKCAAMVSQCALQIFRGIKEIKVMHRDAFFANRYIELLHIRIDSESEKGVYERKPPYIYEAVCVSALVGAICILVGLNIQMENLVPQLAVFAVAAFRIISSAGRISSSLNGAIFSREGLKNAYYNILELREYENKNFESDIKENTKRKQFQKSIEIRNLYWKYPGREKEVLSGINLKIAKGEAVALVGPSGAGKTTIADIVMGLLKPVKGEVLADGESIYEISEEWGRMIGYVPQNSYLVDDTIRNNVAFGIEEELIDDRKVMRALEQAQIKEFVESLEQGINTLVGEAGICFSGGQGQRIAIARALYDDPEILVLDEATSALDNETEKVLMESIESLYGQKTLIIIAHRLSTIEKCDSVYEIGEGIARCIKER